MRRAVFLLFFFQTMPDMSFSVSSINSSISSRNSQTLSESSSLGLGVEAQIAQALAEQKERYDRRHKEVIAAQADKWRAKMKDFCKAAQEKVRTSEDRLKQKRDVVDSLEKTNRFLEDVIKKGKEKEKLMEEDKIDRKAEILILEREVLKIQEDLATSHRTIGDYAARIKKLEEESTSTKIEGPKVVKTAAVATAVILAGVWAWRRF